MERCTAVCSISSEQKKYLVDITANSSMSACPLQERKAQGAHVLEQTHGAASFIKYGIPDTLFILHHSVVGIPSGFVLYTEYYLPTSHFPHIKHNRQTRYSKEASAH